MHLHDKFREILKPLTLAITMYYEKKGKLFDVKVNKMQTFEVPKNVLHGCIFSNKGKTELIWVK